MNLPPNIQEKSLKAQKQFGRDVLNFSAECFKRSLEYSNFKFNKKIEELYELMDKTRTKIDRTIELFNSAKDENGCYSRFKIRGDLTHFQITKVLILLGGRMENIEEALKMTRESVQENKQQIEELYNSLIALDNEIHPILLTQIKAVRETRMTLDREVNSMLTALREIRKFFLENEYEQEIKRLREFMETCKELKKLQEDGILDAVSETIIKLSLGEKK